MITASRLRRILLLATPIIGGMVSQNILNLVDSAMVGVLGDAALAAVGLGGMLNFSASAFILALGAGVQATSARRVGEGRLSETALPLNGGLVLAIAVAVPWALFLWWAVPYIYPFLNFRGQAEFANVVDLGVPYLRARLVAMAAMGMNFCFRGFWNATDRPGLYMGTLMFMHVVNIFLNWVLIFGNLGMPALGAAGAGVASAVATGLGTIAYFMLGVRFAREGGFLRGFPSTETFRSILKLSIPNGIQQQFFAMGFTVFLLIVSMLGNAELAATTVILNLFLVGILPGIGFGLAGMSLVGQALGRKDAADARRWGWEVMAIAIVVVAVLGVPGMVAPELLLRGFLHDPETLELARAPLRLIAVFMALDAGGNVLMNCLLGAGDNRRVMYVSVSYQWLLFLPAAFVVGPILGGSLLTIWAAYVAHRCFFDATMVLMWRGSYWERIRV